jgi:HlyD family secretion protein
MKTRRPLLLATVVAVLAGAAYGVYLYFLAPAATPVWKLAAVERGPIVASVSATGTLNPVVSVQVSSQISGQIRDIFVDFNSTVKAGELIARIAPETYEHRVRQAEADLEAARATVAVQQAELYRAQVNLADAERDLERKQTLVDRNFISPAELDKAKTLLEAARAQVRVTEAQGRNSAALVRQREAQLGQSKVDLGRTEIRAPADGIVIKRSVEPGQTVAASLQAPEMFVIARNLTDMQVETAIDEADVGRLQVGQPASFTVDAFPGRRFKGEVLQVRKAAQVVSNVVSYTVVISAANPDLILLPGMTANVRIVTAKKEDALKVPNAALRFRPPAVAGEQKSAPAARPSGGMGLGLGMGGGAGATASRNAATAGKLWVAGPDGKPLAIEVTTGINDGSHTEIVAGEIAAGREVIVGAAMPEKAKSAAPRMF